jgi:hypothetical protein
MITLADYLMGRREAHPLSYSDEIERNARRTVELVNDLLASAIRAGVDLTDRNPRTGTIVSSGWRPPAVNAATPNAAVRSLHMTGEAIDIYDPDGALDEWLLTAAGQSDLARLGLWQEHPAATKGWVHLQTRPPRSGRRVFYP